ncbi:PEP-CTERM sorting domain-containing protein, partial [Aliiglaciecola sp.]|nr:PEP-CTERM sorting domain-containing protein [Aliiglaciecola sp.]
TNGEGGTGTNSSTIFEFEMGGNLLNTFNLNISADGIGQFGQSNTQIPEPKTLAIFALGIFLLSSLKRRAMVK